ncbi:thioredoxin domain-containing protein [bacterium]|jgi:protein-disulfide isomerase|nr:thioredoxin domain-containing protein [bacterium]MBT4121838.1 thioredoxin domain-containing protein [bacterium]MBT4335264.1 thioredoxin domain-containing protein [bacterium]MBT4495962.1 thioredoxin domain-containing protein [bacterium]MBT4763520.1 thioredoxin domain-containing protein [bacterium]
MEKQKKIIILLEVLLIFFVGLLVVRLILVNKSLNRDENINEDSNKLSLDEPLILTSDPWLGINNSEITIILFESFSCSYCRDLQPSLKYILDKYRDRIKIVWKDFTGTYDPRGLSAAVAARCAQVQGKFWEFHDNVFANQSNLGSSLYLEIAQNLNLDIARFNSCYENQGTLSLITNSFAEARALGVEATPTLYINNEKVEGLLSQDEFDYIINQL